MELNLRKARKLEAKIQTYVDAMSLSPAVKVRIMADADERSLVLHDERAKYVNDLEVQKSLINTRFGIRQAISEANQATGINALINRRENLQALLAKTTTGVDALDEAEANDMVSARKAKLEKGNDSYGDPSVTLTLPVTTKEDVKLFKAYDSYLKKSLEDIEDQLSQKNLGAKISLTENMVVLLQSAGLL